jgi:hypothetical protein
MQLLQQVVQIRMNVLAEDHPKRVVSQQALADMYKANGGKFITTKNYEILALSTASTQFQMLSMDSHCTTSVGGQQPNRLCISMAYARLELQPFTEYRLFWAGLIQSQ